jgi:hypothetical protein
MDTPDHTTLKRCSKCGALKPHAAFRKRMDGKDGLRADCRECGEKYDKAYRAENKEHCAEYNKARYAANKERIAEVHKIWYAANKDHQVETHKIWYAANKDRQVERGKAYYAANKERRAAYYAANRERHAESMKAWKKANPDKQKVMTHRRRARKLSLPDSFNSSDWQYALDYFGGCCAACGRPQGLWHTLAADHWAPLSRGGPTTPDNIVPLCHGVGGCNNSKSDRDPAEWLIEKFGPRKGRAIQRRIETFLNSRKPKDEDADE